MTSLGTTDLIEEEIEFSDTHSFMNEKNQSDESDDFQEKSEGPQKESDDQSEKVQKASFKCDKCNLDWETKGYLNGHLKFGSAHMLTCYLCDITFADAPEYNSHIKMVHKYKCEICKKSFDTTQGYKRHSLQVHSLEGKGQPRSTSKPEKMQTRSADKPKKMQTRSRSITTESNEVKKGQPKQQTSDVKPKQQASINHKGQSTTVDIIDKPFVCRICSKSFDNMKFFSKHMYNYHVKTIKCEICSLSVKDSAALAEHVKINHSYIKYDCDICHKSFSKQEYYELHFNGYCC